MGTTWRDLILDQLDFYWNVHLWPRLEGLTDVEYLWEPAPGAWSLREDSNGTVVIESAVPEPPVPPVTTIAWRMAHIGRDVFGKRARALFGTSPAPAGTDMYSDLHWPEPLPLTAMGGLSLLNEGYQLWREGIFSIDDDESLLQPLGPIGGPYAEESLAALGMHLNREMMAHGAEICLLRDLYRVRSWESEPLVGACYAGNAGEVSARLRDNADHVRALANAHPSLLANVAALGHWDVVELLVALGFPLTSATGTGATALHYAAAQGNEKLVRGLVARGTDVAAREELYGFDPAGWAEYFGHAELADFLRSLGGSAAE
ncbi:ankyrin repeat domain-containing protein [Ancrocorticia populi]|uniref:ankyrin repeat domain-containing protein n=2 Tax=Ancrocorticia populi TaxID=2175228 RepID=UPI002354D347|nr:ankyrin repeat domain-containing protein [Ancrocorticia populi]